MEGPGLKIPPVPKRAVAASEAAKEVDVGVTQGTVRVAARDRRTSVLAAIGPPAEI